jgi:hypothetical protein
VDDGNLTVIVKIIEEKLGAEAQVFIASTDLLAAVKEELSWIDTHRKLSGQLKKFGLKSGRDSSGDKRGFSVTRTWVDEVRSRYMPRSPQEKLSEASEGMRNQ